MIWLAIGVVLVYAVILFIVAKSEARFVFPGAFMSAREHWLPDRDSDLPWDTTWVQASDNQPVLVLESPLGEDERDAPWVLFFHGNGSLIGDPGSVERYRLFREVGFNVASVEIRGYGISGEVASPSEAGAYHDALAGFRYLTADMGVEPRRIVPYGWSMGSAMATWVSVERPVGGLVTEGAFTSATDIGKRLFPWLPTRLVMRTRFPNLQRAPDIDVPWTIFHGQDDDVIPIAHAHRLAAANPRARFVPLNGDHVRSVLDDREIVVEELGRIRATVIGD